ncbi:Spy/CpxP family protein refolding chaperone [Emticicia sp. BO119]|uniref:Spy/CpxP family protein refolding chaperone n=1 Tax=Emticicia sp. BO119 TaxID=2757768 RepID=UPI0015EFEBC4|nr:hypothetical protein [Emticicia sp. BO119]MBA4853109.1 hypothetical protein [Emticicia sp. BO119]
MKDTNRFRILWVAVAVLVVLNMGMIAWFTFFAHRQPPPQRLFLEKELNFDEKQKEDYRVMREEHFLKARALREHIKILKEAFFKSIADSSLSDDELRKRALDIGTEASQLDLLTFKHFRDVRQICTSQQKEKFDEIIEEVLRGMDRQGPPPRREHPDAPPPPDR